MPSVEIVGVHPIEVSSALLREACKIRYGAQDLDDRARAEAEQRVADDLARTVLVEACIRGRDRAFFLGDFGQSDADIVQPDDPVAYDEQFLNDDGTNIVGAVLEKVRGPDVRVAFFLHQYDPKRPILTSYGAVPPPAPSPMPGRLARIIRYTLVE